MNWIGFLRDTDIFQGLSRKHLQTLAEVGAEVVFEEGETILEENAPSDELYVIVEGEVEIAVDPSLIDVHGDRGPGPTGIVTLRSGQTFGEIGLVDYGLRSASAQVASKETRLLAFRREDLMRLCEEDYELGYYLMRNIASELAFKIRNTDIMLRERLLWQERQEV
ncbi:MAG: cyclic nucleotide-binding domain-containing protein [Anaerolineae bacterium]